MRMRRPPLVATAAGILVVCGGCALTSRVPRLDPKAEAPDGPTDPALRYSTGRALQDFPFPVTKVAAAVIEAMGDLGIVVNRRTHDGPSLQVEGRTPDNRSVVVTLRIQKPITHVSCRVGWFGDEPYSRTLLRRVGVRLGMVPPEPIPDHIPSAPSGNPYFSRDAVSDEEMMHDFVEAPYRSRPDI